MGTPAAGLSRIVGDGEGEKDKDTKRGVTAEHRLTITAVGCHVRCTQPQESNHAQCTRFGWFISQLLQNGQQNVSTILHFGHARMVLLGSLQDSDAPRGLASKAERLEKGMECRMPCIRIR